MNEAPLTPKEANFTQEQTQAFEELLADCKNAKVGHPVTDR
jgi:hypothetical protein